MNVTRGCGKAFGAIVLGASLITLTACESQSSFDEAVEEVQDEAKDLKSEVEDEIDDHS